MDRSGAKSTRDVFGDEPGFNVFRLTRPGLLFGSRGVAGGVVPGTYLGPEQWVDDRRGVVDVGEKGPSAAVAGRGVGAPPEGMSVPTRPTTGSSFSTRILPGFSTTIESFFVKERLAPDDEDEEDPLARFAGREPYEPGCYKRISRSARKGGGGQQG